MQTFYEQNQFDGRVCYSWWALKFKQMSWNEVISLAKKKRGSIDQNKFESGENQSMSTISFSDWHVAALMPKIMNLIQLVIIWKICLRAFNQMRLHKRNDLNQMLSVRCDKKVNQICILHHREKEERERERRKLESTRFRNRNHFV